MRFVSLVATVTCAILASPIFAEEQRAVSVTGHAEMELEPDLASVQMGVFVFNSDLLKAKKQADVNVAAILAVFEGLGVERSDIRTTEMHVTPKYKEIDNNWQLVGYEITRSMTVRVRQLKQLNEILNKSIEAGANRVQGITLSSSKEDELSHTLVTQAMENAKRRAKRLAEGFGAKVGKVITIDSRNRSDDISYNRLFDTPAFGEATFQPGRIKLESDINVVFELTN